MPDYHVSPERLSLHLKHREQSDAQRNAHPLEAMAKTTRARHDVFGKLGPNEVLLTNLP